MLRCCLRHWLPAVSLQLLILVFISELVVMVIVRECLLAVLLYSLAAGLIDKFGNDELRRSVIPSLCTMEVCMIVCLSALVIIIVHSLYSQF